ncbi:hypothetical protein OG709_21180 [Streptomyces sp. NBC_01267]|uniref:hypothetical protein n=1 Tax=unclassified Streptomyces TaxID=2593676 RepID=UPI002023D614|nr:MULTISPECIES: hypothetical protein [unclassified Streptomyces]WSC20557.1 hypothetical protein OIE60_13140 [Streptomyces sp. NBC_01766]WSV54588.1 hypothetical protein OG282_13200 [Streptomyces sp. NBC_01014]
MRTTPPPHPTPTQARLEHGYRFEVLRYGPANGFVPEPVDLRILATPREAIRTVRSQLRSSHVLGLAPREATRALYWSEHGGWLPALAALHRGEPCGLVLLLRKGRHLEWSVRPLTYLTLSPPECTHPRRRG